MLLTILVHICERNLPTFPTKQHVQALFLPVYPIRLRLMSLSDSLSPPLAVVTYNVFLLQNRYKGKLDLVFLIISPEKKKKKKIAISELRFYRATYKDAYCGHMIFFPSFPLSPLYPPISVFAVRMKEAWVLSYSMSAQRILWLDWANAQADLSLRWAHRSFCWFCCAAAYIFTVGRGSNIIL